MRPAAFFRPLRRAKSPVRIRCNVRGKFISGVSQSSRVYSLLVVVVVHVRSSQSALVCVLCSSLRARSQWSESSPVSRVESRESVHTMI